MNDAYTGNLIKILTCCNSDIDFISKRILINAYAVVMGVKPSCTLTFSNSAGTNNTYILWNRYKEYLFKNSRLKYFELKKSEKNVLVLIYNTKKLETTLNKPEISSFLNSLGYKKDYTLEQKLYILKDKYQYSVAHELGIFLGLPLKDVMGYMGLNKLPLSCCIGWKIYGNPLPSISLFKQYQVCKYQIIDMVSSGLDPLYILENFPHERHHIDRPNDLYNKAWNDSIFINKSR